MGMADYLSRFPSAAAPETNHYEESYTVAKIKMVNDPLKSKDQLKPGVQKMNQIRKNLTVEGGRSCFYSKRKVVSNEIKRKVKYVNVNRENTRSLEGVVTCNRRLANQNRDICIPAEIFKFRSKKIRRCSQYVKSSCYLKEKITKNMSSMNSPEKSDPKTPSAFVKTSPHSGNVNLNVVLNRVNHPPSSSLYSDTEVIPPEKVIPKKTNSKKLNTIISFPHQFPVLSYPLVQNDKWICSIVPTDSRFVKKIDFPEILNLKLVDANLEKDPISKTIRDAIRDKDPRAKDIVTRLGQHYAQHFNDFAVRENCLWMDRRLAISKDMSSAVLNRLHHNQHGRDKMFAAAKDVWIQLMH